jgi:hypothetical protein
MKVTFNIVLLIAASFSTVYAQVYEARDYTDENLFLKILKGLMLTKMEIFM